MIQVTTLTSNPYWTGLDNVLLTNQNSEFNFKDKDGITYFCYINYTDVYVLMISNETKFLELTFTTKESLRGTLVNFMKRVWFREKLSDLNISETIDFDIDDFDNFDFDTIIPKMQQFYLNKSLLQEDVIFHEIPETYLIEETIENELKKDWSLLQFISDPTEEMMSIAINQDPYSIKYINNPSEELQLLAIKKNPYSITSIKDFDESLLDKAIHINWNVISLIKNPTEQQIFDAIRQNPTSIQYVEYPTDEMIKLAVELSPFSKLHIPPHRLPKHN